MRRCYTTYSHKGIIRVKSAHCFFRPMFLRLKPLFSLKIALSSSPIKRTQNVISLHPQFLREKVSECHGEDEEDDSRAGDLESPTVAPNYSLIGSMIYQRHSLSPSFLFRSRYICFHYCDILIVYLFSIGSGKRRLSSDMFSFLLITSFI